MRVGQLLGRQEPTFALRQPEMGNAAVEAIELYESLGPKLDPWQKNVVAAHLAEDDQGDWAAPEAGLVVQRQNGKGGVTECEELAGLFIFGERVILHTAHLIDTSKTAYKRTVELVDSSDDLTRRVKRVNKTNGEEAIELHDGAILKFRTRTARGGRGLTGDRVTFDEAQELNPEQMEALVPTILARPNPQIVYTGTVPRFGGQFLTQLRKRANAGEPGLAYCEWALERGANVDDPELLARVNPAYGIRVTPKTLRIARAALGEDGFQRECAGIWPIEAEDEWLLFNGDYWLALEDPESSLTGRPAIGVYVPPDRSYSAIVAAGNRVGGGRHMELTGNELDGDDHRPGVGWIVPRMQEINERAKPSVFVVDDKAVFEAAEAVGLPVHRSSVQEVVTGCGMLFDGISGPDAAGRNVHHLGQLALTTAVAGSIKRDVGGSWALDRRLPTVDIGPAAAGALALFGHATPRIHRTEAVTPWVMYA
jgi:hypothetical protein